MSRQLKWSEAAVDALLDDTLVETISESALGLLFCVQLRGALDSGVPVNFGVMHLVAAPAVIFDFNVEGGMGAFCGHRHIVLQPHGRFDGRILEFDPTIIASVLEYGFPLQAVARVRLPGPEPHTITNGIPYRSAEELFPHCRHVVVAGYSFGRFGSSLDDRPSFEFIVDLLKRYPKPVVVVDPAGESIVAMLQDAARTRHVTLCAAKWHKLAWAAYLVAAGAGGSPWHDALAPALLDEYQRLVNEEPDEATLCIESGRVLHSGDHPVGTGEQTPKH